MAWAVSSVQLDPDKFAAGQPQAGQVTVVYTYADSTPPFTYSERLDSSTKAGFAVRAHNAKLNYEAIFAKQNTISAALLAQLQAQDP